MADMNLLDADLGLEPTSMPSQRTVVTTTTIFIVLTLATVFLRAISRPLCRVRYGLEDLLVLIAVLLFWADCGVQIAAACLGERIPYYQDPRYSRYAELTWISNVIYIPCITLVNISILGLYRRLFTVTWTRPAIGALIVANLVWCITSFFGTVFACTPVATFWEVEAPGWCMKYGDFWLAMGILELLLDIVIFILPFFELVKLRLNWTKKILLLLLFSIGIVAIITQICRLAYTYYNSMEILDTIWIYIHAGTAILCACLPTLRPLLAKIPLYKYTMSSHASSDHADSDGLKSDGLKGDGGPGRTPSESKETLEMHSPGGVRGHALGKQATASIHAHTRNNSSERVYGHATAASELV